MWTLRCVETLQLGRGALAPSPGEASGPRENSQLGEAGNPDGGVGGGDDTERCVRSRGKPSAELPCHPRACSGRGPPRGQRSRALSSRWRPHRPPAPRTTPGLRPGHRRPPHLGPGQPGTPRARLSPALPPAGWLTSGSPRKDDSQDRGQGNTRGGPRESVTGPGPRGGSAPCISGTRPWPRSWESPPCVGRKRTERKKATDVLSVWNPASAPEPRP